MFSVTTRIIPVATMTMPTMIVPIILLKILAMMEPAIAKITKTIAIQTSDSTSATDTSFVGPQALAQAYRYIADNRDKGKDQRLRIIDDSHGIWRCHTAGSCSQVCPKGVDPAMGIQLLRGYLLGFK